MDLIFKKPERFLVALGLIFLSAIIFLCFFSPMFFKETDVVYVSQQDYENLTSQSENSSVIINLNTATAEELTVVRGVGPALAQRIVDFRQEHGDFTCTDELLSIDGIGEKILEQIAPYVTVG